MILEIISGIHRFLGYLDISQKYLNRSYTLISTIPTLYILRFIFGFYKSENYMQFWIYVALFFILSYFILLNILYYFFNKNVKWDITQLFAKHLPEDVFNISEVNAKKFADSIDGELLPIDLIPEYNVAIIINLNKLIEQGLLTVNDLTKSDDYLIPKNTLYPYYSIVKDVEPNKYIVSIGDSYENLNKIGTIYSEKEFTSLGLYVLGGMFKKNGINYREPYNLKLIVKYKREED